MVYIGVFIPLHVDEQNEIQNILSHPYASGHELKRVPDCGTRSGDLIPTEIRQAGYKEKREEYERRIAVICLHCKKDNCLGKCSDFTRRANGIYREIYGHKPNKVF